VGELGSWEPEALVLMLLFLWDAEALDAASAPRAQFLIGLPRVLGPNLG
jgi:hypothetical protein